MDILRCVVIASCIWGSVHGGYYNDEHNYDRSCVDCADISDKYREECLCRTYIFAFFGIFGLEYWNEETNQPEGPTVDIVRKVCEYANRDCDMVFNTGKDLCWDPVDNYSPVLNGRWYDVCAGTFNKFPRPRMYAFPKYGYMTFGNLYVLARPGSNITQEMIRDPTNDFTLAYLSGPKLISKDRLELFYNAGFFIKPHNIIAIETEPVQSRQNNAILVDMISEPECDKVENDKSQQIDLIIHLDMTLVKNQTGQDFTFVAELEGEQHTHSLMFRRDDRCLMSWWDEAYEAFICSDGYLDFCQGLNAAGGNRWDICQNRSMCA